MKRPSRLAWRSADCSRRRCGYSRISASLGSGRPTGGTSVELTITNTPCEVRLSHLEFGDAFLMENAPGAGFTAGSLYRKVFSLNTDWCAMRIEDGHTVRMSTDPLVVRVKITS